MNASTQLAVSKDGTRIAFQVDGSGPPLLLVDGAFCSRAMGPAPAVSALLSSRFSVITYDRRGRGESGDTAPYDVQREIEDLQAIAAAVPGALRVYGTSSGAVLAARAVAAGLPATKLVLHEPPLSLDDTHRPSPADFREQCAAYIAAGRPGDAAKLFLRTVGVPAFGVLFMSLLPVFKQIKKTAHTLVYDYAVLGDTQSGGPMPAELATALSSIRAPTLLLVGGKSPPYLHHAAKRVADHIAGSTVRVLPGQMHNVAAKAVAPAVLDHCV